MEASANERKNAKKRFQIEKLEERIAPARFGIPGPDAAAGDHPNPEAGSHASPPGYDDPACDSKGNCIDIKTSGGAF